MRVAIIANLYHASIIKFVPDWLKWLARRTEVIIAEDLAELLNLAKGEYETAPLDQIHFNADMVISLGGDGTILLTAGYVGRSGVPILGIKFGQLGFLVEIGPDEFYNAFEAILNGDYEIQRRMLLEARILNEPGCQPLYAMNDIVIDKGKYARLIRLKTDVDDEYLNTYISDGLIIATPTGSTAYSLSAGGPILPPEMKAMIITPICPHSLSARPVVVSDEKIIRIELTSPESEANLSADGQVSQPIKSGLQIEIRKADYSVNLVRMIGKKSNGFYDRLHTKLNWGTDLRN